MGNYVACIACFCYDLILTMFDKATLSASDGFTGKPDGKSNSASVLPSGRQKLPDAATGVTCKLPPQRILREKEKSSMEYKKNVSSSSSRKSSGLTGAQLKSEQAKIVDSLTREVVGDLAACRELKRFKWSPPERTGSYYEKTAIESHDEFDVMLPCRIRCKRVHFPAPSRDGKPGISRSYCRLEVTPHLLGPDDVSRQLVSHVELFTEDAVPLYFISPTAFMRTVRRVVEQTIETFIDEHADLSIDCTAYDGTSAAMTLKINSPDYGTFCLDLVPAVCLVEWPTPARSWTSRWLPPDVVQKVKASKCYVVPKVHPSG